ncbi:MAG: MerR family transcriptional regulator [Rikenellaceae bacterium]|nr:MerR family transcriptional regulator [Rikenellaceae bacterium]
MESKPKKKIYYTMGEVTEMFDVNPSLIRFWEQKFDILKPHKNKKGNRLFTPADLDNLRLIYHLVKEKGMTLAGAQKRIRENRTGMSRDLEIIDKLQKVRAMLMEIREELGEEPGDAIRIADEGSPFGAAAPLAGGIVEPEDRDPEADGKAADGRQARTGGQHRTGIPGAAGHATAVSGAQASDPAEIELPAGPWCSTRPPRPEEAAAAQAEPPATEDVSPMVVEQMEEEDEAAMFVEAEQELERMRTAQATGESGARLAAEQTHSHTANAGMDGTMPAGTPREDGRPDERRETPRAADGFLFDMVEEVAPVAAPEEPAAEVEEPAGEEEPPKPRIVEQTLF